MIKEDNFDRDLRLISISLLRGPLVFVARAAETGYADKKWMGQLPGAAHPVSVNALIYMGRKTEFQNRVASVVK